MSNDKRTSQEKQLCAAAKHMNDEWKRKVRDNKIEEEKNLDLHHNMNMLGSLIETVWTE